MDPQLKSVLTSIGLAGATAITGWAVNKGYISASDQSADANYLVGALGVIIVGLLGWYKARQHSQKAMIQTVNAAPNGVTVVPTTSAIAAGIPQANGPVK